MNSLGVQYRHWRLHRSVMEIRKYRTGLSNWSINCVFFKGYASLKRLESLEAGSFFLRFFGLAAWNGFKFFQIFRYINHRGPFIPFGFINIRLIVILNQIILYNPVRKLFVQRQKIEFFNSLEKYFISDKVIECLSSGYLIDSFPFIYKKMECGS